MTFDSLIQGTRGHESTSDHGTANPKVTPSNCNPCSRRYLTLIPSTRLSPTYITSLFLTHKDGGYYAPASSVLDGIFRNSAEIFSKLTSASRLTLKLDISLK
jgi:hypothetical protein